MTNAIATEKDNEPMKIFQDKVAAKIRSDIGDLMPDEMLQKLVADAIKSELYRDTNRQNYGDPKPWIQKEVEDAIGVKLRVYVNQQIEEHYEVIHATVVDEIKNKVPEIIGHIILSVAKGQMFNIESAVSDLMRDRGY